jgi:endonuclease/exonuclease/phosphatase family metal-dependent hydrolase
MKTLLKLIILGVCAWCLCMMRPVSRARGRVVAVRVMTYNIHVGMGMDKQLDLARIASVIERERPDLVALQEVDRGVRRTNGVDQIRELARLTGMDFAFAHNLDYQGGQYGVAVLSRRPVLAIDHRRFLHLREAERRGLLRVEVEMGGRRLSFVTTHLDFQHDDNRLHEARQLLAALANLDMPLIVAGDFNDEPRGETYRLMTSRFADAWVAAARAGEGFTYPADKPSKRIDYVFVGPGVRVRSARVVETLASDHVPLVADLEVETKDPER